MTEAFVLYDNSQYRKAAVVYAELSPLHTQIPPQTLALALHNEGLCHREVGEFGRAEKCFVNTIALADRLQMTLLRTKALWHLARVLMRQTRYDDALKVLNPLLGEFEQLGVSHDLACASVDIAESLFALGRVDEVGGLCRRAIEFFRVSGLAYTTEAMTALAYLQEAAVAGRLTVNDLAEVRVVVERLPRGFPGVFAQSIS
jgi:tetratricopeptide (TPR) repeat protein